MKQLIVGLDPSLTGTGVAVLKRDGDMVTAHTTKVGRPGKRGDDIAARSERINDVARGVADFILGEMELGTYLLVELGGAPPDPVIALAVIESAAYGAPGGSTWDRAGLWHQLVRDMRQAGAPVAEMARATQLKWATGSGNTKGREKSALAVPVSRLWPLDANLSDDEWDALGMATAGAQALGWPITTYGYHRDGLRGVRWPAGLELPGLPQEAA